MKTENTGIIYFSKDGNTKKGAELLAEQLKISQIFPLIEKKKHKGLVGFIINGYNASKKASTKIDTDFLKQLKNIPYIYLMTPIWASSATPAVNSFLDSADLSGKQVTIITFQADPGLGRSEKAFLYLTSRIESKGGKVDMTIALHGTSPGKYAGDEHIAEQIMKAVSQIK
jgi:flavodoxin